MRSTFVLTMLALGATLALGTARSEAALVRGTGASDVLLGLDDDNAADRRSSRRARPRTRA